MRSQPPPARRCTSAESSFRIRGEGAAGGATDFGKTGNGAKT